MERVASVVVKWRMSTSICDQHMTTDKVGSALHPYDDEMHVRNQEGDHWN